MISGLFVLSRSGVSMEQARSRSALLPFVLLLLFALTPVLSSQTPPRDQAAVAKKGTGIIRGMIIAADTGAALSGIAVRAFTDSEASIGQVLAGGMSDESGRFEITELPPGEYFLFAGVGPERALYLSWVYGAKKSGQPGTLIELADGAIVEKIVFPIPRAGVITGRVINEKGDPMARVSVTALLATRGGSPYQIDVPRLTDDYGRFRLFGLTPGRYYLKADPEALGVPDGRAVARYLPTFYPAALSIDLAQPFAIEAGQEIADIEIPVRRSRTYRVSGTVAGRSAGTRIHLGYSRDGRSWDSTSVNPDDSFTAGNLLPGEYTFLASNLEMGDAEIEREASAPVVVNVDQDIDGVVLTMGRGARVNGHVALSVDQSRLPSTLRVIAGAPSVGGMSPFGRPPTAIVKADGTFTLKAMFGASVLGVQEVQPSIRQSVMYKGKDITDLPTEFRDNPDPRDLEILLTDKGAEIKGRVADNHGSAAHARLLVFSADQKRWGTWAHEFRDARADAQGRFSIKPLRADKYLVVAFDATTGWGPIDANSFAKLAAVGTPIEVVENEVREVSVTVAKIPQ